MTKRTVSEALESRNKVRARTLQRMSLRARDVEADARAAGIATDARLIPEITNVTGSLDWKFAVEFKTVEIAEKWCAALEAFACAVQGSGAAERYQAEEVRWEAVMTSPPAKREEGDCAIEFTKEPHEKD